MQVCWQWSSLAFVGLKKSLFRFTFWRYFCCHFYLCSSVHETLFFSCCFSDFSLYHWFLEIWLWYVLVWVIFFMFLLLNLSWDSWRWGFNFHRIWIYLKHYLQIFFSLLSWIWIALTVMLTVVLQVTDVLFCGRGGSGFFSFSFIIIYIATCSTVSIILCSFHFRYFLFH